MTAPLIVVLYDRAFLYPSWRAALAGRWRLYFGLALTWWLLALQLMATPRSRLRGPLGWVSVWTYLLNQTVMIVRYLRLAFWPTDLVITYGQPVSYSLAAVLLYAALVAALLLMTIAASVWNLPAAFLGAWFFITLAPSSSFVPIATEVGAERRMYLPLMALSAGIVVATRSSLAVSRLPSARRWLPAVVIVAVLALAAATIARNREHQSWLVLAETTLARWPTETAQAAVGGELARLRRDEEALPLLRIGARSDMRGRYNLGVTLFNLGRYEEAIRELDVLVTGAPMREEVPWARRIMGHAYSRMTRWPDAVAQLRMVLAMTPQDAEARRLLIDAETGYGVELAQAWKFDDAITVLRSALGYDDWNASARMPIWPPRCSMPAGWTRRCSRPSRACAESGQRGRHTICKGKLLALQGRLHESVASLETAVKLRPEDAVIREDLARVRRAR